MKKAVTEVITKEKLSNAVRSTYDDSTFLIRLSEEDDCDFTQGLCLNSTERCTHPELLKMISESASEVIVPMPEFPEYLVFCKKIFISRKSVNDNQIFFTDVPDGYYHSICKYNSHLDVYIKLDKVKKIISFLLGDTEQTLELDEHSEYVYYPSRGKIHCQTTEDLEKFMLDEFWNPRMIVAGRRILKIKPAV